MSVYLKLFAFVIFAWVGLLTEPMFGQGWHWQNPLPQGNRLNDVWVHDSTTVIAVGHFGTILRTIDGGRNWRFLKSETTRSLQSLHFTSKWMGWLIGDRGTIFKTTDGGETWLPQVSGTDRTLFDVQFVNGNLGWAVGNQGLILKTLNGGLRWTPKSSGISQPLLSVYFVNETTGWTVGFGGTILKTVNGGENWFPQHSGTQSRLFSVYFIDRETGWIAGAADDSLGALPTILKTIDGGEHWAAQGDGGALPDLYSIYFVNPDTGWAVGGFVLKTVDGGQSWTAEPGINGGLSIHFSDRLTGWIAGFSGRLYKTSSGGRTWILQRRGTTASLNSVYFIDDNRGWAVGSALAPTRGVVLKTRDGGATWNECTEMMAQSFVDISAIDSLNHWMVSIDLSQYPAHGVLLRSQDGGRSWTPSRTVKGDTLLLSIHFIGHKVGWVVGTHGLIWKTEDGGISWLPQKSGTTKRLNAVYFVDANIGWVVGDGVILKTTSSGVQWEVQIVGYPLYDVYFLDGCTGWVVGGGGWPNPSPILKTTDGGQTWLNQYSGTTFWLKAVRFLDKSTGWVAGDEGVLLHTLDGGEHWTYIGVTNHDLTDIYFVNTDTGWVVGLNGTILKTTTGGKTTTEVKSGETEKGKAESFGILQNHPNPFNLQTRIRFHVPVPAFVSMKIYDIVGREIRRLVQEPRSPGTYNVNFEASGLASGIYVCRLDITDGQRQRRTYARKMILLK